MSRKSLGIMALAAASLGLAVHVPPSRGYRRHYSSAYTDGAVCQYPVHFPLPDTGKPRSNKNRNYRKARKKRALRRHFLNGGKASRRMSKGFYSWGDQS